jgi:hypothetical protein
MNTNLLDLDDDILNIIGDDVKKDNIDRLKRKKDDYYKGKMENLKDTYFNMLIEK